MSIYLAAAAALAQEQPIGVASPIVEKCGSNGKVVCVNKYVRLRLFHVLHVFTDPSKAAVLPYHFNRTISNNDADYDFRNTSVPSDPSFDLLVNADFVVFDRERGARYLGSNPSYEFVFSVSQAVHEAPIYSPTQNLLFLSQLAPPAGVLPQLVVNLNDDPPTLSDYLPNPPIYAPNAGTFRNGQLLYGASGGNDSVGGTEQRVSIRTVDLATNQSTVLLNNYFGFYFNNINDLAIHPVTKDIFFTDPADSWFNGLTDTAPQLPPASYRFNPDSGAVFLIENSLEEPNGIAFSPDGGTLYISDTASVSGSLAPGHGGGGTSYVPTGKRAIYAYDVSKSGTRVTNKRAFYLAQDW